MTTMRPAPSLRRTTATAAAALLLVVGCGSGASPTSPATPAASAAPAPAASGIAAPASSTASPAAVAPTPAPAALTLLWQGAGPKRAKTETYWPAIDPVTGDVWVASTFDNQFWIFTPDGRYLEAWGASGSGPGQFKLTTADVNPDGIGAIAFAPDGSFFVSDGGNYRVQAFDGNRRFLRTWGTFGTADGQFGSPRGIATDGTTVWVADDPRGDVQAFDTRGRFLRSFQFPFVLFARSPSGNLVVPDASGILELDGTGSQVAHLVVDWSNEAGNPSQPAVDAAGHVFVGLQADTTPTGMLELAPDGTVLHRWSTGGETMTLVPDGSAAYVAYTGANLSGWPYLRKYALPTP
jgi:hypothetical protein